MDIQLVKLGELGGIERPGPVDIDVLLTGQEATGDAADGEIHQADHAAITKRLGLVVLIAHFTHGSCSS